MANDQTLRYPIGEYRKKTDAALHDVEQWNADMAALPQQLRQTVQTLTEKQLDTPYRPDGWTIRQVVHHMADALLNAFVRVKLALTEDSPTVKPFEEDLWAKLPDSAGFDIEPSLRILESLQARWTSLAAACGESEWSRTFYHPAGGVTVLRDYVGFCAWHGRHHLAQIVSLLDRMDR